MTRLGTPFNLQRWIEENRHLLRPPVGNKMMWNSGFMVMIVGGPNQRADYHVNPGEELFYQVEGDIVLRVIEDMPFPVLMAAESSYAVASKVHDLIVKTRPSDFEKIALIRDLIAEYVDVKKILNAL